MVSATTPRSSPRTDSSAVLITPGPLTPTLMAHSGSPGSGESACHKRVVLRGIGKNHQFAAAPGIAVGRQACCAQDDLAHLAHRVHIDAGAAGRHIDRGADQTWSWPGFRDRGQQPAVTFGVALVDQRGKSADEIDAEPPRRPVEGAGVNRRNRRFRRMRQPWRSASLKSAC